MRGTRKPGGERELFRAAEEARKMPGVAEVMDVYERAEAVVAAADPYFLALRPKVVYSTSGGSS